MGEWFEWIARKIWICLRVFLLLLLLTFPNSLVRNFHTSQGALLAITILTLILATFYWWRAEKNALKVWDKGLLTWKGLAIVVGSYLVCYLGGVLGHYVMELQGHTMTANEAGLEEFYKGLPAWFILFNGAVLPAVVEEVLIRGYLFKLLFGRQQLVGLILTSLLFGFLHGPTDLGSWIIYTVPGFVLGYVYVKTDYLIYPIAIHFLNNVIAILL